MFFFFHPFPQYPYAIRIIFPTLLCTIVAVLVAIAVFKNVRKFKVK